MAAIRPAAVAGDASIPANPSALAAEVAAYLAEADGAPARARAQGDHRAARGLHVFGRDRGVDLRAPGTAARRRAPRRARRPRASRLRARAPRCPRRTRIRFAAGRASRSTPRRIAALRALPFVEVSDARPRARAFARGAPAVPAVGARRRSRSCRSSWATHPRGDGAALRDALGRRRDADRGELGSVALPALRLGARARPRTRRDAIVGLEARLGPGGGVRRGADQRPAARGARATGSPRELVDLRNSGDTAGDRDRVVGYGAFAFTRRAHDG